MKRAPLADVLFVLLAASIVGWVAWDAFVFRLITHVPGSDYWEHSAVLRALIAEPWHPRHPLVVTDAGSPRFNPHFLLVALTARALHWGPIDAMALAAVFNAVLFAGGIFLFFRVYFRDAKASLYALVVFFGTWLAKAPHFSNVYKLSVFFSVAGYPSTAALALTLFALTLTTHLLRDPRERPGLLALSAVGWAYIYVTHPLTAMMAFTAALLLALTEPNVARRRRVWVALTLPAGLVLTGFWPYYPAFGMVMRGTVARVSERMATHAPTELHPFYAPSALYQIVGFALLGVPCLGYFVVVRKHLFVVLGALAMLGVFVVSAWFDVPLGHRFVLLAVFFLQIALVFLLLALTPTGASLPAWARRTWLRILGGAAVAGLLTLMAVTNVQAAVTRFQEFRGGVSPTVRAGRRIGQIAGDDAVILGEAQASWSLPTFGPRIVSPHHSNPLVPDTDQRRRDARRFFAPGVTDQERARILAQYRVTHVLFTARQGGSAERFVENRSALNELPYGLRLYTLEKK